MVRVIKNNKMKHLISSHGLKAVTHEPPLTILHYDGGLKVTIIDPNQEAVVQLESLLSDPFLMTPITLSHGKPATTSPST